MTTRASNPERPPGRLDRRVAVIIGAASGIGRATAMRLGGFWRDDCRF